MTRLRRLSAPQIGAREVVVLREADCSSLSPADVKRIRDVLSRCGAMATERPRSLFSAKNLEQDVARLVKVGGWWDGRSKQGRRTGQRLAHTCSIVLFTLL